jgi:hypothetical protein
MNINTALQSMPRPQKMFLFFRFSKWNFQCISSLLCATYPANLLLSHLIILLTFCDEHNLWSPLPTVPVSCLLSLPPTEVQISPLNPVLEHPQSTKNFLFWDGCHTAWHSSTDISEDTIAFIWIDTKGSSWIDWNITLLPDYMAVI